METPENTFWLDTETKAALQRVPPEKIAPAVTDTFAVVVLSQGALHDHARRVRAFHRVLCSTPPNAELQTTRSLPFALKRELTLSDAMLAQFELICCDIVSVFLSDDVVSNANPSYLVELYRTVVRADEFQTISIRIVSVPEHAAGRAFTEQFIGSHPSHPSLEMVVMRKKARVMYHWAKKIGANVVAIPNTNGA